MISASCDGSPEAVVERLVMATNAHDVAGIARCFSADYVNETPVHPARGFRGREQVRTNWQHILSGVPDLQTTVLRTAVRGDAIWTEWEMSGTQRSGAAHLMCGVIIFGIADGLIEWARFYLEPIDRGSADINAAVGEHVGDPR